MKETKPVFLLAGGNFRNPGSSIPLFARVLQECGRQKPRVACLGVANGDNEAFFRHGESMLKAAGAAEVFLTSLAKPRADLPAAREALESADAVYISGGEVDDGMRWLERHGLVGFLRELYNRGKLFFGMSAGTIMMGTHWVRWKNPGDDATAELFDCLGFVPTTFDTHAEDEDWKELKMVLRLQGSGAFGYAIPSGGMVSADDRGRLTDLVKSAMRYMNNGGKVQRVQAFLDEG